MKQGFNDKTDSVTRILLRAWTRRLEGYDPDRRNLESLESVQEIVNFCMNNAWFLDEFTKAPIAEAGGRFAVREHMVKIVRREIISDIIRPLILEGEITMSRGRELLDVYAEEMRDLVAEWNEEYESESQGRMIS